MYPTLYIHTHLSCENSQTISGNPSFLEQLIYLKKFAGKKMEKTFFSLVFSVLSTQDGSHITLSLYIYTHIHFRENE
ncbi:hypothetical protein Hanom_Chr02g00130841 [Helianthus anomalus]